MTFWCIFNFHRNQYAQITVDVDRGGMVKLKKMKKG